MKVFSKELSRLDVVKGAVVKGFYVKEGDAGQILVIREKDYKLAAIVYPDDKVEGRKLGNYALYGALGVKKIVEALREFRKKGIKNNPKLSGFSDQELLNEVKIRGLL